ncbi:MAG: RNA polymerase sigma factor [Cytophagaceae bacterium]
MTVNKNDLKIIESIRNGGNDIALTYLYDQPLKKIRKYIMANQGSVEDGNDIFQDAVIIFFNQVKMNKYKNELDVDGFLFTVARNLWIDKVRREKKIQVKDLSQETGYAEEGDHLQDLIGREKSAAMRKVFEKLDEKCQKILRFAIDERLSMKEISAKMGYSNENVAKSNHYRCKQYLSKLVKDDIELVNLLRN